MPGSQIDSQFHDPSLQEIVFNSPDDIKLHAFYFPRPDHEWAVLFLHGNAGNASHRLPHAQQLANLGLNVLLLEYRGYGKSEGTPSEQGVYRDANAAIEYLVHTLDFPKERILIFGRSIGTAVAIEVAQQQPFAGLILVAPLLSGRDMARHHNLSWLNWLAGKPFDSAGKISLVTAPVLFIHGDRDQIIPIAMGRRLFDLCTAPKEFRVVSGAGHNDVIAIAGDQFWEWVNLFISSIKPSPDMAFPARESV
jgi:pimeloyl-ACP methyl ester carboxylesterase